MVVIPARRASASRSCAVRRSSSSPAARVASIVVLMPPASYGVPAMRAANSALRSPAKTRWVWLSTKPGITQRPSTSTRSSHGGADPRPMATTTPSSITTWASCNSPCSVFVTSNPMPSIATLVTPAPRPVHVRRRWWRGAHRPTTTRPPMTTWWTSAAVAANTTVASASSGPAPTVRTESRRMVVRSAGAPGAMRPASGQPRLAWPFAVAIVSSAATSWCPRVPVARRSSSSTARASSSMSMTACESLPRVISAPAAAQERCGGDAVGEVALGGRAQAAPAVVPAEQPDVAPGDVHGVDRGERLVEHAAVRE